MTMKTILTLLFISCLFMVSLAQTPQWKIYNTTNSKIPWNKFKSMVFDKTGDLWGAYDNSGAVPHLTRFNGDTFINYLENGWVNYLTADKSGDIWFTTSNMELQNYKGNFVIYSNSLLSSPWMEPVFVDPAYNVWIANKNNNSLIKFTGSNWLEYKPDNSIVPESGILCMASYKGDLWFGTTDSGLVKFGNLDKRIYNTTNSTLPSNRILALLEGKGDTLWMVCQGYLGYFDGTSFTFFPHNNLKSVNSLQMDSKGIIWISNPDFTNGGVYKYDRKNWTIYNKTNSPLPTNQLLDLKIDKNNNIWIATWGSGLVQMSPYVSTINENLSVYLNVFPNPANEIIQMKLPDNSDYQINLFNSNGQQINNYLTGNTSKFEIDISFLPEGIYFLTVYSENFIKTLKFIKN